LTVAAFFKVSGAGNDFIALIAPEAAPSAATIRAWCRPQVSIGADGVFLLEQTPDGARMVHFNSDGGRAELCLNGSRCAAQLAFELGWHCDSLILATDAGDLAARRLDAHRVAVELPPIAGAPSATRLAVDGRAWEGWTVEVGVPHFVLPWPETLRRAPVAELGPRLRRHPDLGERGANVDFVRFHAPDRFEIRSFERGVEAETLACGTGVVATAVAGVADGRLVYPVTALTTGGFEITVERSGSDRLMLGGDARIVAQGTLLAGAVGHPPPAVWL